MFDIDIRKTVRSPKRAFALRVAFRTDSQRVVIVGPSGSGKSLTLQAIAGLLRPDEGRIAVAGTELFNSATGRNLPPQARKVGYLFQDYALFPHLNVRQNIGFGLNRGWFNRENSASAVAVDHWLDMFRLRHVAHQRPDELSGGQRQRVALARALAPQPSALLLDEPFAALDRGLRARLRGELDRIQRHLGIPMILITHDEEDAALLGDHVVRLRDGMVDDDPDRIADAEGECDDLALPPGFTQTNPNP
ncbi:ATP-binding cassette domain-containing protein [Massilia terrae]|uniref:ATP-binding cassette domain-containing protein n=1 Tax=Massilia terrae TaxID=1811224 RepID=A0ABT2CUR4_9BURK|nr:ATP-binding cassette domain-containing protein [Massilia terrae]MCS0657722.1 ATP-binding cassette domain-containing protein [Massilia terrae]